MDRRHAGFIFRLAGRAELSGRVGDSFLRFTGWLLGATFLSGNGLLNDIGFAGCRLAGPVPLALGLRPGLTVFSGTVQTGSGYNIAEWVEQFRLASAVA